MYLPKLIPYEVKKHTLSEFKGINARKLCGDGEFKDTLNLCSCDYPVLSTMPKTYLVDSIEINDGDDVALFYNNGRGVVSGSNGNYKLNYKGEDIGSFEFPDNMHSGNILNYNGKTLLARKDKRYEFDTESLSIDMLGFDMDIEYVKNGSTDTVNSARLSFVYDDYSEIGNFSTGTESSEFPSDASEGDCFARYMDFYRLVYNSSSGNEWVFQTSLRLRIDLSEDCRKYKKGDYIQLSGIKYWNWAIRSFSELERFFRIDSVDEEGRYITEPIDTFGGMVDILFERTFPSNDITVYDDPHIDNAGNDLYLLEGKISACMPELDFILNGANRVWGCSNSTREIYACELGNVRNWSVFEGLASDSYAVSVASTGDFTACISYLGVPVFFKEDEMIVINGSRPASFQLNSYSYRGVSADSPGGLCVVNDILYYKSYDGIYAYSGSKPSCVSDCMFDEINKLSSVLMAGEGDYLFVSGEYNGSSLHYVYDTKLNVWHKYSRGHTYGYLRYPDATLEFCESSGKIGAFSLYKGIPYAVDSSDSVLQENDWCWESGDIFYNTPSRKYVGKISLDTECSEYSELFISYNGGVFKKIGHFPPHKRGSCDITLFAERCDHFRIKMKGKGSFALYNITSEVEEAKENG